MKKISFCLFFSSAVLLAVLLSVQAAGDDATYPATPPFTLKLLRPVKTETGKEKLYSPRNPYSIFINYELGMHCVGFDVSYCCIIPPYNSVQAQAVRAGLQGEKPRLLSPEDKMTLTYSIRDNSYSEGNKMKYWGALKDVTGSGTMTAPGDNMANYVWDHLFIYKDLKGSLPEEQAASKRLHIGKEIPVNTDSGPSGKPLAGGTMDYSGEKGGNIVFTDSFLPEVKDVPLTLTSSYLWDALGLPLTAFNDSRRKGSIRTVTDRDFQPYQYAVVQLSRGNGKPVIEKGKRVEFFGTEPIDISNCPLCHSGQGMAAVRSRQEGLSLHDKEYAYWKKNYPDATEYIARLSAAAIGILELHDRHHGTHFLKEYDPDAASNRLGNIGSVNCADCHGQNISGNLQSPRPGVTGYPAVRAKPLTVSVHSAHARAAPMPDKAGRTQSCQACHPGHWQNEKMNEYGSNLYRITDENGNPRFSKADLRTSGGGCFLRRDAHTNPGVAPPFFLNEIGKWYLRNVSMKDEEGHAIPKMRGLYCTNCHNHLSQELYRQDDLRDAAMQKGKTLRDKPIKEVIEIIASGDERRFKDFFADPVTGAGGEPLYAYYEAHKGQTLVRSMKDTEGKLRLFPWNSDKGETVSYASVSAGDDWWLSAGEPHCADCHRAPFVESEGGRYFPIDQPGKYSLYRYSKAHGVLACQSCHESIHGLYPVRYEGAAATVDLTTHEQALQFSPDGKYAGPVTCAACHTVNSKGIPVQLRGTDYYGDYWASVVLIHFMREGDEKMPVASLVKKYPFRKSREIVARGWR